MGEGFLWPVVFFMVESETKGLVFIPITKNSSPLTKSGPILAENTGGFWAFFCRPLGFCFLPFCAAAVQKQPKTCSMVHALVFFSMRFVMAAFFCPISKPVQDTDIGNKKHEGFGILRVFLVILLLNKREKIFSAGPLTSFGKPAILSSIKGSSRRFLALIDCDNLDGRWPSASFRNWQDFYCGKGHNGSLFLLP